MLTYHLVPESNNLNSILKKISDYFLSFVGDIEVVNENEKLVIKYLNASFTSDVSVLGGVIEVKVFEDDSLTINLLKNITASGGFRIFNTKGCYFLPNDPKLLEISGVGIKKEIYEILKKVELTPLFQYRDTLIFFCLDKSSNVVITNRHYLDFLTSTKTSFKVNTKELFKAVSPNIASFIALMDRGLINLTFQSFKIDKLPKDVLLQVTNFKLNKEKQKFEQQDTVDKLPTKNYLNIKIGTDYTYTIKSKKLFKIINVFVYYK